MNPSLSLNEEYLRLKYPVARLLQPVGGILSGLVRLGGEIGVPDFNTAYTSLNNVSKLFPYVSRADGTDASHETMGGAGADLSSEKAWIRAVMEGAERYATMAYSQDEFVTASADELGNQALDMDLIPRCSDREYSNPRCPLVRPDKTKKIRWVKGFSLTDRQELFVPAVMTHLYFRPLQQDRYWHGITTGVAAHNSFEAAALGAICEMVERDAIAITWLAKLSLPKIEFSKPLPSALMPNFNQLNKSLVKQTFFDATSDFGIPTVYTVQCLDGHPNMSQYVNCATEFNAVRACAKTIREAAPARFVFNNGVKYPQNVDDFLALHDGASYLGRPEKRHEFDFLLNSKRNIQLNDIASWKEESDKIKLKKVLEIFRSKNMNIVAVDLTTDELRELGIWVIRVVIPGLVPMSPVHRARFLGHPRLYSYPKSMGFGSLCEDDINPAPQPFA